MRRKYCAVHIFTVTSQTAIYFDAFRFADTYTNFPIIRTFHILSKSKIGKQLRFLGHASHCRRKQAHRAHKTVEMLRHGIPEIITRDLRRSNSLDLSHVDYWYGSYSGTFIRDDAHVHVHTCTRPLLCKSLQKFNISINGYGGNDGIRCYKNQLNNIFERKTFIEGCRAARHRRLLVVTYCNAVIVTENHLHFVIGCHIVSKVKRLDKRLQVSCTRY